MMKISKSVLLNDFTVSPVQFTSLNSVLFKNVKAIYDGYEKIVLEYEYQSKIDVSSRDWIGIFPRGWNTLQQYVTFEWVSQSLSSTEQNLGEIVSKTIAFCPKYHINAVNSNCSYQFVYVSKQIEVLGVSSYFRFDLTNVTEGNLEFECLIPVSARLRSTSFSDFGALLTANNESSSTSLANRMSIHSLQTLISDGKYNRVNSSSSTISPENLLNNNKKLAIPFGTGDAFDPYSSHSEPGFPMTIQMNQCKKCFQLKRGGDVLKTQQILQSKLKIVMERNKILEQRAQDMKKEMERLQSDSKKTKMSFYHLNKEKVAYEKFVKDLIKSLEKDSFVRVMNGNSEILVKKVNYVGMEEHPRDKKTSKRERELKAVIGLQEITIRNLINNLQEKAKSVEELNQAIKLAQAFSAATDDTGESVNDADETRSQSEAVSECEFTLTRPQPPEEVPVDTDAVLHDIRRATENELKNIGIERSLEECSSRDSEPELDVRNLTVLGCPDEDGEKIQKSDSPKNESPSWSFEPEPKKTEEKLEESHADDLERCTEASVYEDFFDASDRFSVKTEANPSEETTEEIPVEKSNEFLISAIVPKKLDVKPDTPSRRSGESQEKLSPDKGKTFTCEFSIDFRPKSANDSPEESKKEFDGEESRISTLKRENSLITFKKSEKCLEIEFTQETAPKNCIHQKMVVKFGNNQSKEEKSNPETETDDKIEFNLDPTSSVHEKTDDEIQEEGSATERSLSSDSKSLDEEKVEAASPRTVWNDAVDVSEDPGKGEVSPRNAVEEPDDTTSETSQESIDKNMLSEDSKKNDRRSEEENRLEKPSAILIQNGSTKVALIRYQ